MKNKSFGMLLVVVIILFTGYTTYSSNQVNRKLADLSLVNIESLAGEDDDIMDGGELGGGGITCSTGGSGTCYAPRVENVYGDQCSFRCRATGNPNNYCNAILMGIIDFCINLL